MFSPILVTTFLDNFLFRYILFKYICGVVDIIICLFEFLYLADSAFIILAPGTDWNLQGTVKYCIDQIFHNPLMNMFRCTFGLNGHKIFFFEYVTLNACDFVDFG